VSGGDLVEVYNDDGSTQAMVYPTPTAKKGHTFMLFAYPTGVQGNVIDAGTNELILPNYKQTWANVRKLASAPDGVKHLRGCASTVHVVDLRTNTEFDIWEERGTCGKGCRLDERGLATASHAIDKAVADRVDLIIMNRFGRAESLGSGLLASFSSAISAGLPVLIAVRPPYDLAWAKFHGGLGQELPASVETITAWAASAIVDSEPAGVAASQQGAA